MPTKALTILIADEQHLQRLHIEKMLNQLGYYRIVPVQTFEEVLILTDIPAEPFDVLVIHAGLAASAGGALALAQQHQVRHVLVYDDQDLKPTSSLAPLVLVRLPGSPDSVTLEHFMDIIDPPSPARGLRVLPWLRELARSPVV
ncbi:MULTISPECIES: chemotaxis protein CheY [unclassified Pseudomonas]|uniref:chemotaxis protein CheY n=1 Tax=unclassified Pseudomonas TaxID=196821 RepID=UPI0014767F9D|nr:MULTISPECIES: chemotaxis protein CheY [unclassified Pseudomonas]NMX92912.1 chemotaxis protein CheY [Pseudomonas sp. WS 5086]NMY45075.1 chemotaxis protein CheY [Pseudomonas sp. WS 5027]